MVSEELVQSQLAPRWEHHGEGVAVQRRSVHGRQEAKSRGGAQSERSQGPDTDPEVLAP